MEKKMDERAAELYAMLTEENRERVIRYVARLRATQCTPVPSPDSPQ